MLLKLALTFPMFEQQGLERFGQLAAAHGCITGPPAQPPCAGEPFCLGPGVSAWRIITLPGWPRGARWLRATRTRAPSAGV